MNQTNSSVPELTVSRWLLRTPLASTREIASFMCTSESKVHDVIRILEEDGEVASLTAGIPGVQQARRYWLTMAGIREVALANGEEVGELLETFPVSREWLHALLRRLDAVIAIYQLATAVAQYAIDDFRWYRTIPIDAAVRFPNGEWLMIHREGPLATLFHRRRRLRTLEDLELTMPMLVLVPDEVRQRDWRRRLRMAGIPGAVAVEEQFLATAKNPRPIWHFESWKFQMLEAVLETLGSEWVPSLDRFARVSPPPHSLAPATNNGTSAKDYELPLLLSSSEKQILNLIAAWPLMTVANAADFLGVTRQAIEKALRTPRQFGLLDNIIPAGRRATALALSNRGLLMLAKRDRVPTQRVLQQWSVSISHPGPFAASEMRGTRMRPLLRAKTHTAMVTDFFASLHRHAREAGDALENVESLHRSWRAFADRERGAGQLRPDGFGVYVSGLSRIPFFLEWERRADRRDRYVGKLRPYIKYYRSNRAWEDAGDWPFVLLIVRNQAIEGEFWDVAMHELSAAKVAGVLRVLTATEQLVLLHGPHRAIWRVTPDPTRRTLTKAADIRRVVPR